MNLFTQVLLVVFACFLLGQVWMGLRRGEITLKRARYTKDEPLGFAFVLALLMSMVAFVLGMGFSRTFLFAPLGVGMFVFLDGMAMFARLAMVFLLCFLGFFGLIVQTNKTSS